MRVKFNILINRHTYYKQKKLDMLNVKNVLRIVVGISVIVLVLFYVNRMFKSYQLEINLLTQEVSELNQYADDLIEYIESIPDTVVVNSISYQTRTILKVDTVLVETVVDYYDIDSTITAPFSVVDKQVGAFIKLEGYSVFEWNIPKRKYMLVETTLTDKLINLNLLADYLVTGSDLDLRITNPSTQVNITYIENQTLDLSRVHTAKRSRWGLGIVGGIGLVNSGFTPFVGVGVTYQFKEIELKKLLGHK